MVSDLLMAENHLLPRTENSHVTFSVHEAYFYTTTTDEKT